jgi:hypothetical protein
MPRQGRRRSFGQALHPEGGQPSPFSGSLSGRKVRCGSNTVPQPEPKRSVVRTSDPRVNDPPVSRRAGWSAAPPGISGAVRGRPPGGLLRGGKRAWFRGGCGSVRAATRSPFRRSLRGERAERVNTIAVVRTTLRCWWRARGPWRDGGVAAVTDGRTVFEPRTLC